MSEMVERVARAFYEAQFVNVNRIEWETRSRQGRNEYMRAARAAIAAMRDPTEAMLEAGPPEPYMDCGVWAKMIDAALADETMTEPTDPKSETVA